MDPERMRKAQRGIYIIHHLSGLTQEEKDALERRIADEADPQLARGSFVPPDEEAAIRKVLELPVLTAEMRRALQEASRAFHLSFRVLSPETDPPLSAVKTEPSTELPPTQDTNVREEFRQALFGAIAIGGFRNIDNSVLGHIDAMTRLADVVAAANTVADTLAVSPGMSGHITAQQGVAALYDTLYRARRRINKRAQKA